MITIEFTPNVRVILEHIQLAEFFDGEKGYVRLTLSSGETVTLPDYTFKKMDECVGKRLREIQIQQNSKLFQQ